MTPICILNLSQSDPARAIEPCPLTFGQPQQVIADPNLTPSDGSLILYIVGHAVPDALLSDPHQQVLGEIPLAKAIQARRGSHPTLIVWDVCFAKTFLEIPKNPWGNSYVHIFSSQPHERSWHTGHTAGKPVRQSLFSTELELAIAACKKVGALTWMSLQAQLRQQFGRLQTPEIVSHGPLPATFQL